ncbi:MAG TPA: PaaI family thioesterase [Pseudomonadales bacterium]|nr:PaaI family thioesterase [Pseudomonadales bacterium]
MGIANYFDSDPDFTEAQEAELVRLTQSLRQIIDCSVKLNAPLATLQQLANDAEAMVAQMQPYSSVRPIASHNKIFDPDNVNWSAPYSPVVGRCNPLSPPMQMVLRDGKAIGEVTFGDAYEGPPNCVHGGMIALTWDHVLALSNMLLNARGPTAWLHVDYKKPTPLLTPLRFEAWIDRVEGKKIFAKGACYANGEIVTEASGLFINTFIKNIGVDEELMRQLQIKSDDDVKHDNRPVQPPHFTAD